MQQTQRKHTFRTVTIHILQKDGVVPAYNGGVVYLVVSTKDTNVCYVGQTGRTFRVRLNEHNSGHGCPFTSQSEFMPWAPLAIVHGFPGDGNVTQNRRDRLNLEQSIKDTINNFFSPEAVLAIIIGIVDGGIAIRGRPDYYDNLKVERLGRISRSTGPG